MSYEVQDFRKEVIEASESVPVVIDFWAEWCGPCRQLGPVIEKLAGEAEDRWKLVKINTDRHPDIASQLGVRGIPAVKMVYQKQIVAEFTGAQPEHQVRKWLEQNLPINGRDESEETIDRVKTLLAEGNRDKARGLLKEKIDEDASSDLKARHAMLLLPDQPEQARQWLEQLNDRDKYAIEFLTLDLVGHLSEIKNGRAEVEGKKEAKELYREAVSNLFEGDFEEALKKFIKCVQMDREMDDDGARKACISCFTMLGEEHPLTKKYRRRFSMSLY